MMKSEQEEALLEAKYEKRGQWLADHGARESEVLFDDEDGREYVLDETDNGNPGEDGYDVRITKLYLPSELNIN